MCTFLRRQQRVEEIKGKSRDLPGCGREACSSIEFLCNVIVENPSKNGSDSRIWRPWNLKSPIKFEVYVSKS